MKNLKLKAARAGKDLSQQALADLVGVSRQTIAAVEKGVLSGAFFFLLQTSLQVNWFLSDYRYWQALGETKTFWEFSDSLPFYLLAATCFFLLGISLLVKYALEKWGTKE